MSAEPLTTYAANTDVVDADNPWPGLAAFREVDQEFFHGRDSEIEELLRLVLRDRLTVLFGLSGFGKTSLLQAGLFPRLRKENVLPVRIRLDFSEDHLPLVEQVKTAILGEATAAGVEAPALRPSETLWELFHRQGAEFWSSRNRILTPLLVFDQFEEIFTLGREDGETEVFLDEIASLCEGSPPESVRVRLDKDPAEARTFSFTRHPYKVLLSLREDFLPDLEELRDRIRSIGSNRLRLYRINGENAFWGVTRAGGLLIDVGAAERVVRFVAGRPEDDLIPLAEFDVEPALLSVICRELNNKRRAQGASQITADLLQGNREEILSDFYERSVADLNSRMRTFIEENLLTVSGFRDSVALENALRCPGVTQEAIGKLTDRRLLRIEERGGVERLELTHDVLTGVIRASRDSRREWETREQAQAARHEAEERERKVRRELQRQRRIVALLATLLVAVAILAFWTYVERKAGRKARSVSDLGVAASLRDIQPSYALAYLARALKTDTENLVARTWLTDLLLRRTWPVPTLEIRNQRGFISVDLSPDGRHILATTQGGKVQICNARTGHSLGFFLNHPGITQARFSQDGRRIVTSGGGKARIWDAQTKRLIASFSAEKSRDILISVHISPDASILALLYTDEIRFLDMEGKQLKNSSLAYEMIEVDPLAFSLSPDGKNFLIVESFWKRGWRVARWSLPPDSVQPTLINGSTYVSKASFNREGTLLAIASQDGTGQVWDVNSRQPIGNLFHHGSNINSIHFSMDSRKIVTASEDRSARVWDSSTGFPLTEPLQHTDAVMDARFSADGRQVITASRDGTVRAWNIQTGRAGSELLNIEDWAILSQDASRVASIRGGRAYIQELPSGKAISPPIGPIAPVLWPRFSSDGQYLSAIEHEQAGWNGRIWDVEMGRTIAGSPFRAINMTFSPDGRRIAATTEEGLTSVRDLQTGQISADMLPHKGSSEAISFSPNSDRLTTAPSGSTVRIWNSESAAQVGKDLWHDGNIMSVEFSPDGHYMITASMDGTARIWDAQSGIPAGKPLQFGPSVEYAEFGPDGRFVLLVGEDRISTFDRSTGRVLAAPLLPGVSLRYHGLSKDGMVVATSTSSPFISDKDVRLLYVWHPKTGEFLGSPFEENNRLQEARLRPDGRILYTVVEDVRGYSVHAWQISAGSSEDAKTLVRLAEVAGGLQLDEDGRLIPVENWIAQINVLRNHPVEVPDNPLSAAALARWFFADRSTRTLSPLARTSVPEFIRSRLARGTREARDEALKAYPDHPIVLEELRRTPSFPPPSPN